MAVTIDAFRSGVSGLSSGSRIALRDDQVCKAGLRQRIACHFEGSVARMENLETINALKAAALNDPRYSGMRDKVEREFAAIDTSRMLRAKDVRNIFSNLDSRVFMNEDGRKLFLNREVKMRLLAISRPAAAGVQKAETDARWNFDFDDEWIRAPTAGKVSGPATSMQQWMPHIKELEPLVNRMIDNLAAEKGGIFNITAKDAADLTARIKDLLGRVADNLTSRSFPEEYHSRTISIMAQILASDPSSIVSENAVCCAANKLRVTLDELMFCRDVEGKTGIMEDAMDWMAFTGNSFWTDYELTVFATYHSELGEAVRGLGLSKSQADAILHMVPFESARKGNLHATFTKGTVEFRLFQFDEPDGTRKGGIHAGQLKSYIQLCLALSQMAKEVRTASPKPQQNENPKYAMRTWLLRLGFIGDEFKTARDLFTKRLEGDAAFRSGRAN